jgi:predicted GTPase
MSSKFNHASSPSSNLETKSILFIGATQNGKSSLIKRILLYGGDIKAADTVRIGNGSLSMTQSVSQYEITIPIREHQYQDKMGNDLLPDEDDAEEDIMLIEVDSGVAVRLNLIDTPGLSDSGNGRAEHDNSGQKESSLMSSVDEVHKLGVMLSLLDIKIIHAVCFVIKLDTPYSKDFRRHINDYISFFRCSSIKVNYHIIHTRIEDPSELRAQQLRTNFEKFFTVNAAHHFVDNEPTPYEPSAVHFHNLAISQLLKSFSRHLGVKVTNLNYPKTNAHRKLDRDLQTTYDVVLGSLNSDGKLLDEEIEEKQCPKRLNEARKCRLDKEISDLNKQIGDLDTSELVEVGESSASKPAEILNWKPTLYFNVSASATIQKITMEEARGCRWLDRSGGKGTCGFRATLQQTESFNNAWGKITLYGYKRDEYAYRIKSLREELSTARVDRDEAVVATNILDKDIKSLRSEITRISEKLAKVKDDNAVIQSEYFSIKQLGQSCIYFTCDNIYASALGYGLKAVFLKSYLRTWISANESIKLLKAEQRRQNQMRQTRELAIDQIIHAIKRMETIKQKIESLQTQCQNAGSSVTDAGESYQESDSLLGRDGELSQLRPEIKKYLSLVKVNLIERRQSCLAQFQDFIAEEGKRLQNESEVFLSVLQRLNAMIRSAVERKDHFSALVSHHKNSSEAADTTIQLVNDDALPIGAFTIVRKAIDDKHNASVDPYITLYHAIVESRNLKDLQECGVVNGPVRWRV